MVKGGLGPKSLRGVAIILKMLQKQTFKKNEEKPQVIFSSKM
jgi:hypothetical protein